MAENAPRVLSEAEVSSLIPHERPFRFIDGATILEPGKKAIAPLSDMTHPDFDYLKAHFKGMQIIPGAILVEAMAEVLGVAAASSGENSEGKMGVFRRIKDITFRLPVRPTDSVTLEAELTAFRHDVGIGKVRALLGERVAVQGVISFALADREQLVAALQSGEE